MTGCAEIATEMVQRSQQAEPSLVLGGALPDFTVQDLKYEKLSFSDLL
jgi:hypothetical protein